MKKVRITLDEARLGMRLAADVFARSGQRLLAAGKTLTPTIIEGLRQRFIFEIQVLIPNDTQTEHDLVTQVQETSNYLETLMTKASLGERVDYAEAEQAIAPLLFRPEQGFQVVQLMTSLYEWHHYTYNHGVAVAALAATIGHWLELGEQAFFELAMAGYLHDLGKAMMPMEVLNKPSGLDEHEWEEARKHPVHAYELLRDTPGVP
jgi:HD-GYP domain-containing protein (c-di-GMP phosphodiesterase class II)